MIARLIRWSIANRFLVLLATLMVAGWGVWAMLRTPLDAIPDLSDVQVIIRTTYPGQAPQIVENQITYPLATTMMSVPGAKTVRGYSMFGDSFVYILFEDGTVIDLAPWFSRKRRPAWGSTLYLAKSQSSGAGLSQITSPPWAGSRFASSGVIQKFTLTAAKSA